VGRLRSASPSFGELGQSFAQSIAVLVQATNGIIRLFLEPPCCACDLPLERPLSGPVCPACWRSVLFLTPPLCERCGDALAGDATPYAICPRCSRHDPIVSIARSAGRHDAGLRQIIHAFKYGKRRALAAPLSRLMRERCGEVLAGADAVVPVPLHPWRALARGFNQADDLARHLGPPVWRVLRRVRRGPPQAALPAARRHANVRGAYAVRRLAGRRLKGRTLVLIDDVMTTGATLEACGEALAAAGATTVRALTVARAVAGPPA
jgi:ComF family protein